MIRALSVLGSVTFLGGILLLFIDADRFAIAAIVLILISIPIGIALALRRAFTVARDVVSTAKTFVTGDVQHARIAEVGEPRGIFTPSSNLVLELEGEDGAIHRFDREVPVPMPVALSYRLGRRLKLP